ncbi:MAG: PTS sugar transporter subunit IIA, partial [Bacteroidales bacterium]|nr:PTS sugar transporter subunit IIA [Bacteroidales bacterium]
VGIAGVGNEHLEILARLGETLEDSETLEALCTTSNPETILEILERD